MHRAKGSMGNAGCGGPIRANGPPSTRTLAAGRIGDVLLTVKATERLSSQGGCGARGETVRGYEAGVAGIEALHREPVPPMVDRSIVRDSTVTHRRSSQRPAGVIRRLSHTSALGPMPRILSGWYCAPEHQKIRRIKH
eukprot:2758205-Rhodomonas_salina.2